MAGGFWGVGFDVGEVGQSCANLADIRCPGGGAQVVQVEAYIGGKTNLCNEFETLMVVMDSLLP